MQETRTNVTIIFFFIFHSECCTKYSVNIAVEISILESDVRNIYIHIFSDIAAVIFSDIATDRPMKKQMSGR